MDQQLAITDLTNILLLLQRVFDCPQTICPQTDSGTSCGCPVIELDRTNKLNVNLILPDAPQTERVLFFNHHLNPSQLPAFIWPTMRQIGSTAKRLGPVMGRWRTSREFCSFFGQTRLHPAHQTLAGSLLHIGRGSGPIR